MAERIVASIEARMGSTRFPGKVLADLGGQPALSRLIERLRRARTLNDIVLATTTAGADDVLEAWADDHDVAVYRGCEDDVLGRVTAAHRIMDTDVVVEVTGDCVLLDPELVDQTVTSFLGNSCDVVTNAIQDGFPLGMAVDVFRFSDLIDVEATIADPAVREHVSLYFYERPERYRVIYLYPPAQLCAPDCRLVLDYPEDLKFLNEVWVRLSEVYGEHFGIGEIMALLRDQPELGEINRHCVQKTPR